MEQLKLQSPRSPHTTREKTSPKRATGTTGAAHQLFRTWQRHGWRSPGWGSVARFTRLSKGDLNILGAARRHFNGQQVPRSLLATNGRGRRLYTERNCGELRTFLNFKHLIKKMKLANLKNILVKFDFGFLVQCNSYPGSNSGSPVGGLLAERPGLQVVVVQLYFLFCRARQRLGSGGRSFISQASGY